MAIKERKVKNQKKRPSLLLRVRAAGKIVEESILHPSGTSYVIMDPEKGTVTVRRNGNKAS